MLAHGGSRGARKTNNQASSFRGETSRSTMTCAAPEGACSLVAISSPRLPPWANMWSKLARDRLGGRLKDEVVVHVA